MEERQIVRRRSHLLVYAPGEGFDRGGERALNRHVAVWERVTERHSRLSFRAAVLDTDPKGRRVLRLPAEVPRDVLAGCWPGHRLVPDRGPASAWPARGVAVGFRSEEYPCETPEQQRIVDYLSEEGPGTRLVKAPTSAGKSYASIRAWARSGTVLLGTFAQSSHLENYLAEILKFTAVRREDVLVVDDGMADVRRHLDGRGRRDYAAVLVLHRTVWNSVGGSVDWSDPWSPEARGQSEFARFAQALGVGVHVSDEVQLEFKSLALLSLMANFRSTYYLSATPARTDGSEDKVLRSVLPFGTMLEVREAPRLEVRMVRFDSRPAEGDEASCARGPLGHFCTPAYFDYVASPRRWPRWEAMVRRLVAACFEEGAAGVAVVVSGKLKFLDAVVDSMREAFPGRTVGNFSSRVRRAERAGELDRDIIVTTEKSFNGSVNPPRTSHMVLLAPIASPVWLEQVTGRLRGRGGLRSVVLDVWDGGFAKAADQMKERRRKYKKIAKSVSEEDGDF